MKKIVIIVIILMQSYYAISDDNFLVKPEIFEIGQAPGHYTQRNPSDDGGVIDMLVMHYTAENIAKTFKVFLSNDSIVSSHYVISEDGIIFSTIKDQFAARHAGNSYWRGITGYCPKKGNYALNLSSLGIEHINMGYRVNEMQPDIAGTADLETAAILNALICNYRALDGQCPCVHE